MEHEMTLFHTMESIECSVPDTPSYDTPSYDHIWFHKHISCVGHCFTFVEQEKLF